jgi:hypothetical protein
MARKMIVVRDDGSSPVLTEAPAENEAQLQELVKDTPDLLPIDEFDMAGPLMVVGRETTLPSGSVDLVALARGGELLIVEFKTGPQNTDFRQVVAQLLDYGSDLWEMSYEVFESTVAQRFFASDRCQDLRLRGKQTLSEAASAVWPDLSEEDASQFEERVTQALTNGAFHYLVVAQRFTRPPLRTIEYLNKAMPAARFYAVELVRFGDAALSAFESRTVLKPQSSGGTRPPVRTTDEDRFLASVVDELYREALRELLEVCRGLSLRFEWGTMGTSIRLPTADRAEPLSIGWLFPSVAGWMGLRDLNLGYDPASATATPSVQPALEQYVAAAAQLPGAEPARTRSLSAYHFRPDAVVRNRNRIADLLAELVRQAGASA